MSFIYKITNDINDKIYIGKTNATIQKRWQEHCHDFCKDRNKNRPLYWAMNKYGIEHFKAEKIEECEYDIAEEREVYWINYYNSYMNGYNATLGGDGKSFYDHQEIIDLLKQHLEVSEICNKVGCCRDIVYQVAKNNNLNVISAQEIVAKKFSKGVVQYSKEMSYIQDFSSIASATRWLYKNMKIPKITSGTGSHITDVCNGKRKTAYGYIWKYVEQTKQ